MSDLRAKLQSEALHREDHPFRIPTDTQGKPLRVSEYFGANIFDFRRAPEIEEPLREQLYAICYDNKPLERAQAEQVAKIVTDWAIQRGATHFCHWFQPLTGGTAEKHDAFLDIKDGQAIERLSASQLMQGEPDASSFPSGGSRSTFEARGYTSWDMTSPMFLIDTNPGKILCIPTAFVSYHGHALDVKTPLLRSISQLSSAATKFCHLLGDDSVRYVYPTCGCEQEYFLVDKAYFYARQDLVMTGRTLFGSPTNKHQQLDDHYFGAIPERVRHFMEELNTELYLLGIPAKTQHNEVAPGQFEIAPIFEQANIAADHNQLLMALIRHVARRHGFEALLHEKPFARINGSGKHLNWSMATSNRENLLEPGNEPHSNHRFLCLVSVILEALNRHSMPLRMAIASHGNDHRLGANEAPPSIISMFIGSNLDQIFQAILEGKPYSPESIASLDIGSNQLAQLKRDNTDRNRTSPFAFTGNKFEFRAVGSSQPVSFPLSILNAAVTDVLVDTNLLIEKALSQGDSIDTALSKVTQKWLNSAKAVIFNGDGYSEEWVKEAEKRKLPNLRHSPEAYTVFNMPEQMAFLTKLNIFSEKELSTRKNVLLEKYVTSRLIEFDTLKEMVFQQLIPSAIAYKKVLAETVAAAHAAGLSIGIEKQLYETLNQNLTTLHKKTVSLAQQLEEIEHSSEDAFLIAEKLMPLSEEVAELSNALESQIPEHIWELPKYYDMLFLR